MSLSIGFGDTTQFFARPALSQFKGKADNPLYGHPTEHRRFNHHFYGKALVSPAPGTNLFTLGVFTHHNKINIADLLIAQRPLHTGHQHTGSNIGVLVKALSKL